MEMAKRVRNPAAILEKMGETFKNRNQIYSPFDKKSSDTLHSELLRTLFPNGIPVDALDERFIILNFIIGKLARYVTMLPFGHEDSAHDIGVYGAILASFHTETVK